MRGERILHSGQSTSVFYDVNALLTERTYLDYILHRIPCSEHYVGIATGGALIALAAFQKNPTSKFSMIKDGELKGALPLDEWILVDDVVTTGNSLTEAIKIIGEVPSKIIVAVDRRTENKNPEVKPIFEI